MPEPSSWSAIANARLVAEQPADEDFFTDAKSRDIENSHKAMDLEFAEVTGITAGSGAPQTINLARAGDRIFPADGDRLVFEADVLNSDGATTGSLRITVGGVDVGTITVAAGDTSYTSKTVEVTLGATGRRSVLIEAWRDTGSGSISVKAPGVISRTYNSET